MADYASFRQRLDAVLRTLDVKQVQQFMQDEGQWDEGTPVDPQFAMYMMIAGTQTLRNLHERAGKWLIENGHEEEAQAVLGRQKREGGAGKSQRPGGRGQQNRMGPQVGKRRAAGGREG